MYGKDKRSEPNWNKARVSDPFDRIFCYNIKYNIKQTSDENKEKYQLGDY